MAFKRTNLKKFQKQAFTKTEKKSLKIKRSLKA